MRIVRNAALVLLFPALCACSVAGTTEPEPVHGVEQNAARTIDPESAAPRMDGGYIGSGT